MDEVEKLKGQVDYFLDQENELTMNKIRIESQIQMLGQRGIIPFPISLTEIVAFLGKFDTSSLLPAVLMSPAMGETASDGRGYPVVKHKPGNKGWGHEAAPVVRRQHP